MMPSICRSNWSKPSDVKAHFGSASILQDGRAVFNIGGTKYAYAGGNPVSNTDFGHIGIQQRIR
jgi:hypothetical protein